MKIIVFIAALYSGVLFAQTQQYDILLVGADIGDMSVTKKVNGSKKTYLLESYSSVMFGSRKDAYTGKMEFENNLLVSSSIENKKNGKLLFFTYVNKVGDAGYKVQTEKGLSTIAGKVGYCCYDIFFQEPKEGESLFSERWGKFGTITKTGDHDYKVIIKGAEDYIYHYEGGKMERMDVPSPVGKVKFVMK